MISAVVLVNTDLGAEAKVIENIKLVNGVEEAHALYGIYDLLIKIKAISIDKLKETIKLNIRPIAGVTSSLTLMIVEDHH
jgi:DNA-binding Lrp family transcriptional regulator